MNRMYPVMLGTHPNRPVMGQKTWCNVRGCPKHPNLPHLVLPVQQGGDCQDKSSVMHTLCFTGVYIIYIYKYTLYHHEIQIEKVK